MAGTSTTRGAPPPMAAGGTTGQVLTKASNASYDTEWTTPAGGGGTVTDVTASAPLSSTGGATPDISIGGGTAGQVLTSNGALAPTFEDLPAPPTVPDASNANGTSIGTAAPGVSTDYARGDHVHDGSLGDLDDVSATAPTLGQVLAWSGSEWAPATPAAVPAASSSTPAGLGTAAVGVSTDYARADHVHAGTVTALTDRYEELPAQTFSEFAHASTIAASPTRDIQTAIDATPVGPACQVIVGPGSYGGATVTIPAGRNNISIIGPSAGDFGGTIASLSSSRALTIGNNVVRARIVSLQIEGLTTVSTTGSGVHRFEQSQMVGGLTIGAISATIYVVGCSVGNVSVDAGFTGTLLFDRCLFTGTYTNGTLLTRVLMSDCAGLAAAPTTSAVLNGRFQISTGSSTFYADGTALLKAPLTAINGLTPAADRIAYYTSASAGAMTALTAFGRSLIDDVDAAAARTTLGLGTAATSAATAFQAADATLTALAGVTTAADKLAYFTGVDTAAATDITTAGREILSTATSGTNGQVLTSSGGGAPTWTTVSGGGGGGAVDVQAYTADATWTKPAGASIVQVIAIGGGGGGGSGLIRTTSTTRGGGAGGGGGGITNWTVPAASLTGTVAVTVGAGGAGGAATTSPVVGVNGNPGTAGTASTFGAYVYAAGGAGGAGGAGLTAPVGGAGATASILAGGTGGNGGAGATTGPTAGAAALGAAGGGGGGSITSGNTPQAGATGGAGSPFAAGATSLAGGSGGATGGAAGSAGTSATTSQPYGGGGGGGGGANHTASGSAPGGDGGAGGSYGAGGGGGGAGTTTLPSGVSGAGGAGANGIVYVITY